MKERKSFLHRASQQSLSTSYEKEAADGLDYLGNEEEIETALNDLEKKTKKKIVTFKCSLKAKFCTL